MILPAVSRCGHSKYNQKRDRTDESSKFHSCILSIAGPAPVERQCTGKDL
jgi:hypothetical protein